MNTTLRDQSQRRLTGRFFALYGFTQLLGVMSFVFPIALIGWGLLTVIVLIAAFLDRAGLANASDVEAAVELPPYPHLGDVINCKLKFTALHARWFRQSRIRLMAPDVSLLEFSEPFFNFSRSANRTEILSHEFKALVTELGYAKIESIAVTVFSPSGLFQKTMVIPTPMIEFRASPERRKLDEQAFQELIQTQKILYQGARRVSRSRAAEQFHSIRKYQYPDPLRHIDPKKSARYSEPMTRVFEAQHNHHLVIALDTGRSMVGTVNGSLKSDYFASAALALAENAIRSRDRVSLFSFAGQMRAEIRGSRSLASFLPLFRSSKEFKPLEEESNYRLLPDAVQRASGSRAIVIVLTDLSKPSVQDALLEALAPVCRKHLTVVVSLTDRDGDLDTRVMEFTQDEVKLRQLDSFKELYSELLYSYYNREKLILFRDHFARLGGASLTVNDRDWLTSVEKLYDLLRSSQLA